jgi:tetratricopeptide (TPR) repeat protein
MSIHLGDRIEDYVLGRMAPKARDAAELHLLSCRECFEATALLEAAVTAGREHEAELFGSGDRFAAAARKASPIGARWRAGLAAIWERPAWGALAGALAAGLAVVILGGEPRIGGQGPGRVPIEAYPLPTQSLRAAGPDAADRAAGMESYARGDYDQAARRLDLHLAAAPDDDEARFYLAVSLLLDGKARAAIPHLDRLVATGDGVWRDSWYLAQAYLAIGEPDAARPYLRQVAASQDVYAARAREQLAALPTPGTR